MAERGQLLVEIGEVPPTKGLLGPDKSSGRNRCGRRDRDVGQLEFGKALAAVVRGWRLLGDDYGAAQKHGACGNQARKNSHCAYPWITCTRGELTTRPLYA